jgi:hypothetical protein
LRRLKSTPLPNPRPHGGRERAEQAAPRVTQSIDQRHKRKSAQRSRDQKTPTPGKTPTAPAFPPPLRGRDSEGGKLRSRREAKRSRSHPPRGKTKR